LLHDDSSSQFCSGTVKVQIRARTPAELIEACKASIHATADTLVQYINFIYWRLKAKQTAKKRQTTSQTRVVVHNLGRNSTLFFNTRDIHCSIAECPLKQLESIQNFKELK